jgi:hypothetical protein
LKKQINLKLVLRLQKTFLSFVNTVVYLERLPLTVWSEIMAKALQLDLPWLTLRSKIVQEDPQGILYKTMFHDLVLDNSKFQLV